MSIISPDIRKPCGSTSLRKIPSFGGCGQQSSGPLILKKKNITQMIDYASMGWINPYAYINSNQASCGNHSGNDCGNRETPNGNAMCGIPLVDDIKIMTGTGTGSFSVYPYLNTYGNTNTPVNDPCTTINNIGFKNAYAKKIWQGRYSYSSAMNGAPDKIVSADYNVNCEELTPRPVADSVKYLSMVASATKTLTIKTYNVIPTYNGVYDCGEGNTLDDYCISYELENTITRTSNANCSCTINKYSGNSMVTLTSGSSYSAVEFPTEEEEHNFAVSLANESVLLLTSIPGLEQYTQMANGDNTNLTKLWQYYLIKGNDYTPGVDMFITGGGSSWHFEIHTTQECPIPCSGEVTQHDRVLFSMDLDLSAGTLNVYNSGINNDCDNSCYSQTCCPGWSLKSHTLYSWSGTDFNYTFDTYPNSGASLRVRTETHIVVTGKLSIPYTCNELQTDIESLLSNLPLDRDDLLPWRQGDNVTQGPICYYDEHPNAPNVTGESDNSSTGELMGAPGPSGIDHVFDPSHENMCMCNYIDSWGQDSKIIYTDTYGAWNDSIGGGAATKWLNDYEASSVPQGAFIGNGFFWTIPATGNSTGPTQIVSGDLMACKYAERIFKKQSVNFARPCGIDRFQIDNTKAFAISAYDSNTKKLSIEPTGPWISGITTNTLVWVCGINSNSNNGLYKATKIDNYNMTLTSCVVSASNLYSSPIENCGTGIVAPLKWQTLKPAICGRIRISTIVPSNPAVIVTEEPTYLVTGDSVTITNAVGGNINGTWIVEVIGYQSIKLLGCAATDNYTADSGQIYSTVSADWKWNDHTPKNDFVSVDWTFDYRGIGEYNRTLEQHRLFNLSPTCVNPKVSPLPGLGTCNDRTIANVIAETHCAPFSACSPSVACWTPNNDFEDNPAAVNLGFGGVIQDPWYGAMWQGVIKQSIDDPFWQRPPNPPEQLWDANTNVLTYTTNGSWTRDTGICSEDTGEPLYEKYYPMPNQVEARIEVPVGAPALTAGIKLMNTICNYPFNNAQDMFDKYYCNLYSVNAYATPWIDYLTQRTCVCNNGRFAGQYMSGGISCGDMQFVPAP